MDERRGLGSFRHHLILTSGLSACVFAALVGASIFLPLAQALDRAEPGSTYAAAIADQFLEMHRSFWPVVAGALIASVGSGLLLYQRMVGPLVRFRQIYRQLAAGRIPGDLSIRHHDYLTQETAALNELLGALRARSEARELGATRCGVLVDELEAPEVGLDEKGRARLSELREELEKLR